MTTRKRGRPNKRSATVTKAITTALAAGNTRTNSAKLAGISYDTLKRWCRLSAPFCTALEKAEAQAEGRYVGNIKTAAAKGNWQAAAWWLERRRHDDWRKPVEQVEHTVDTRIRIVEVIPPDGGPGDDPGEE